MYGASEKQDGDMGALSIAKWKDKKYKDICLQNRRIFLRKQGVQGNACFPLLRHGSKAVLVSERNYKKRIRSDGLVTAIANTFLFVTHADCFPIYFYDPVKNVAGLAHAGWRGVLGNITRSVISLFVESFGSRRNDILVAIGPGIQNCHFLVRENVIQLFRAYTQSVTQEGPKTWRVDLPAIIDGQAKAEGIETIESCAFCTFCMADVYFSFRRDKPRIPEVMISYIGIRGNIEER